MKAKYLISIVAYIAALISGSIYLYLLLVLFAFMYKVEWIQKVKTLNLKHLLTWGLSGGLFAFTIQTFWGEIQKVLFKITPESIHTNYLVATAKANIGMIILICIVCPILEEIIFRKIIFESFKRKIGVIAAAIVSTFLFSVIHFDFANIANYILIGLVFSVIYIKSKNLMNSMISHMVMNTIILTILIR